MAIFWSPSTAYFYDDANAISTPIPGDAVGVTDEQHSALMEARSQGKTLVLVNGIVVAQ